MLESVKFARVIMLLIVAGLIIAAGVLATQTTNEGTSDQMGTILAEVKAQYLSPPYTNATLPATVTDIIVNRLAVPASWRGSGACAAGSYQTPRAGCWSVVVAADETLHVIFPGHTRDTCITVGSKFPPDVFRDVLAVGIARDGAATLSAAVTLSTVAVERRAAAIMDFAATACRATSDNQIAFQIR